MTDLYLIAHKVRGEPAFDVATQMECPICEPIRQGLDESSKGCHECDYEGHWWIIPTSGHRAYPIMHWPLSELEHNTGHDYDHGPDVLVEAGPLADHPSFAALPDHYITSAAPKFDLIEALGIRKAKPLPPIPRRI